MRRKALRPVMLTGTMLHIRSANDEHLGGIQALAAALNAVTGAEDAVNAQWRRPY